MNQLHLIDTLWIGGAQSLLKYYFEDQKDNENIHLIALRKRKGSISIDHPNVFALDYTRKIALGRIKEISKFVENNNIEIVHCHLQNSLYHGVKLKEQNKSIKSLIFHDHAVIFDSEWLIKRILNKYKAQINKVACCSRQTIDKYKHILSEDKISFLPNAIDVQRFKFASKNIIESKTVNLGFAGRFVNRKGWKDALYMLSTLQKYNEKQFNLLMAGDGPDKHEILRTTLGLKLKNNVIISDSVKDIVTFFNNIDVLVVSSYWEGMPLIVLEAFASGIPVVAYNVSGINELIIDGKNGLLSKPGNYTELAEKTYNLISNQNFYNTITDNALEVVKKYHITNYINNINSLSIF
ncbi:MAG: glycosyltransferase family 4 protein [Marinilabiliales bacterium]